MFSPKNLRCLLLRSFIAAISASGLLGIYAFLVGDFGQTEAKILLTTLSISYFSITSLSCLAALEKKRCLILPGGGVIASCLGFAFVVPLIWMDWPVSDLAVKWAAIFAIFAFSLAQVALLEMVTLPVRHRWIGHATRAVILAFATLLSAMILMEPVAEEWYFRLLGVLGILNGTGSLSIPILSRLSRPDDPRILDAADELATIELACPRCGQRERYPIGSIRCVKCDLAIHVRIGSTEVRSSIKGASIATEDEDGAS